MRRTLLLLAAACAASLLTAGAALAAPPMWVVRDEDSTLYLFGSMHVAPKGADWTSPVFERAYAEAQEVWTETAVTSEQETFAAMQRHALDEAGRLETLLGAVHFEKLAVALEDAGYGRETLRHLRPWFALWELSLYGTFEPPADAEADTGPAEEVQPGPDVAVRALAPTEGKRLRALESAEEQVLSMVRVPDAVHIARIRALLDDPWSQSADITPAWLAGDLAALERQVVEPLRREWPDDYEHTLRRRNQAWTEVLAREMAGSGVDLVLVGTAHLVGDDSVVAMLTAKGFKVERIQ